MTGISDQRLRLTLRQLEVFSATARAGSTRAAADKVSRSQSAASSALADLESLLGVPLFDRVGRRLVLNENGRAFLPRAAALLDQALEVESLFAGEHATRLRMASSFTIGEYLLPPLIAGWKEAHPRSQVQLDIANTRDVLRLVADFDVDVGFIEGTGSHPSLHIRHWMNDEIVIVAAPGHPLAGKSASLKQLAAASWIVREQGSGTREATDRWLTARLDQINISLELGSNEAIKRTVASGLGLGCLSRHAITDAVTSGVLVMISSPMPPMQRSLSMVVHQSKQLGSTALDFVRHCFDRGRRMTASSHI